VKKKNRKYALSHTTMKAYAYHSLGTTALVKPCFASFICVRSRSGQLLISISESLRVPFRLNVWFVCLKSELLLAFFLSLTGYWCGCSFYCSPLQ